ncbi:acyl-CoA-binding domain-containing protein 6 isoform X4 [Rhincodon typus]|uniref:acyl-CoA-binding domain-containing protein 6 isoform X4 n=1 Tax=Rhincodon typus TaxID=259920 RepID=UPI00202EB926|nr:acyl-CoA-binding domain-containing protein 6 isoform X4 [Rhincodon typus]
MRRAARPCSTCTAASNRTPSAEDQSGRNKSVTRWSVVLQAKFGKCNIPKPGFFDFEGKQKWEAWKAVGDMTAQQAMQEYIAAVNKLDPEWNPQDSVKESDQKLRFGGPVVSSLYQEEMIREEPCYIGRVIEDIKIWLVCCSNKKLKSTVRFPFSKKKFAGLCFDHSTVCILKDSEGQTALHYASACEFADIVELLLNSGADPTIQDGEGCLPEEVTDSKDISQMLRQYAASKG